ncbi:DUF998 domain-containing protein [Actinoplanes sp. NPDC051851]|uniref:DUF998 domain-containing protein n=1 Tax=Actinoplanes sp. NPDC051851 TaxID=3154753 RepID=UPI0034306CF1
MRIGPRTVLALAALGVVCVATSLTLFALLHVLPPSASLDWTRRTISQYALLPNGWVFDTATLLLAAGSAGILIALHRTGVLRRGAVIALAAWVVGLIGVVWFQKHSWSGGGPSISGDIHRFFSLVAFVSLPAGALLAAAPWLRHPTPATHASAAQAPAVHAPAVHAPVSASAVGDPRAARSVALGGAASLLCFTPILYALISQSWTGVRWWQAIPLGTFERLLGLVEVTTVLLLAWWAIRATRTRQPSTDSLPA